MIEVVAGSAAAAPGGALVVRVVAYPCDTAAGEATIAVAVADPALGQALAAAMGHALEEALGPGPRNAGAMAEPQEATSVEIRTVRVRSRKGLARDAGSLRGAIAIVPVTARNARHLVALVDGVRAAGALGVQLVWDGAEPLRGVVEHRVFAALEHARATPGEPPVVLAATDQPAPALRFLIAHQLGVRTDERRDTDRPV